MFKESTGFPDSSSRIKQLFTLVGNMYGMKPEGFRPDESRYQEYAFSGIHVLSPAIFQWMTSPSWDGKFSIMDFYLATCRQVNYGGYLTEKLHLIDIGKPETLAKAEGFLYQNAK